MTMYADYISVFDAADVFTASRLLRRKIPCTGHLMTPRRLWIQTVPTRVSQHCIIGYLVGSYKTLRHLSRLDKTTHSSIRLL